MRSMADTPRRAVSIGPDVPPGTFPVRVHSVFRAAVNVSRPDGDLLTLLSNEACDGPQSIRLATVEDFAGLFLAPGADGSVSAGTIVLDRTGGMPPFRVDCSGARHLAAAALPPVAGAAERWSAGVALLGALQERAGTDLRIRSLLAGAPAPGALGERLARAALDLGRAVQAGSMAAAGQALSRLIGLGPGLTPAGDDFLCGFHAAALCRSTACPARSRLLAAFARAVRERLDRTTALSATFLRSTLAGHVVRPLAALAEACAGTPGSDLRDAILQLARIGHSSGLDAATGFFHGLTVWSGPDQATQQESPGFAAAPPCEPTSLEVPCSPLSSI